MKKTKQLVTEAYEQIEHDRALLKESYDKFSEQVTNIGDYAVAGQNLNKTLELLGKQTAALIEVAKLASVLQKDEEDSETNLSHSDIDDIHNRISDGH